MYPNICPRRGQSARHRSYILANKQVAKNKGRPDNLEAYPPPPAEQEQCPDAKKPRRLYCVIQRRGLPPLMAVAGNYYMNSRSAAAY
eukprot:6883374-Pyramimonas_sp.AAC.1